LNAEALFLCTHVTTGSFPAKGRWPMVMSAFRLQSQMNLLGQQARLITTSLGYQGCLYLISAGVGTLAQKISLQSDTVVLHTRFTRLSRVHQRVLLAQPG